MTKLTRKEWAARTNYLIQCGSVVFNETLDSKENLQKFKKFVGKISNTLTDLCEMWNEEASKAVMLSEETIDALNDFDAEIAKADDVKGKKARVAFRKKVRAEYQAVRDEEKLAVEKLTEFHSLEEELSFGVFPSALVPANINGAFLDKIDFCLTSENK